MVGEHSEDAARRRKAVVAAVRGEPRGKDAARLLVRDLEQEHLTMTG